jgi:hypothetical protein
VNTEEGNTVDGRATYYCLRCLHPIADDAETRIEGMSLASRDECVIFKICSVCKKDRTGVFTAHSSGTEP